MHEARNKLRYSVFRKVLTTACNGSNGGESVQALLLLYYTASPNVNTLWVNPKRRRELMGRVLEILINGRDRGFQSNYSGSL
jgi:hypothetical protein